MKDFYDAKEFLGYNVEVIEDGDVHSIYKFKEDYGEGEIAIFKVFPEVNLFFNNLSKKSIYRESALFPEIVMLEYCLEGAYELERENHEILSIRENDIIFHSAGEKMLYSSMPTGKYKGVSVMLDLSKDYLELDSILSNFGITIGQIISLFKRRSKQCLSMSSYELRELFASLYMANNHNRLGYYRTKLIELFILLIKEENGLLENKSDYNNLQKIMLEHIVGHMTKDLSKNIPLDKIAKEHGISLTTLKNYFKKIYKISPHKYLKNCRINYAKELLLNSDLSIAEIAGNIGYQNPSKFSYAFKELTGKTPTEYRKTFFWD